MTELLENSHLDGNPDDPCFIWHGSTDGKSPPYGKITIKGKKRRTHRASYRIHYGHLDDDMVICHKCDTPLCWNPLHLSLGTQSDNMRDMHNKGRHKNSPKRDFRLKL